jgi:hypothetical protein
MKRVTIRAARNGLGLFAAQAFAPRQTILHVTGRIHLADVLWERGGTFADNCYRFGPETYLDPGDSVGRYVNHSCAPNAGVRKTNNRLYLFAAARIAARRELTIDYSTILGDDDIWTMRCNCGMPGCRSRVRRFGSLPRATQASYVARGMVPGYILRTLRRSPM